MPGAGLTNSMRGRARLERPALKPYRGKPAVRILGGTMETSASFEARSAPSSYPTQRTRSEVADPRGVVDQQQLANGWIRRPQRHLVQDGCVVDGQIW